jgi:hypothetical protein
MLFQVASASWVDPSCLVAGTGANANVMMVKLVGKPAVDSARDTVQYYV